MLLTIVSIIHIVLCGFLICIVLLQQGKGADMGAAFGGGSNTLFGASGADNLLTRVTTVTAFLFMCTSVFLASSAKPAVGRAGNIFQNMPEESAPAPAPKDLPSSEVPTAEGSGAPLSPPSAASAGGETTNTQPGTTTQVPAPPAPVEASGTNPNNPPPQGAQH